MSKYSVGTVTVTVGSSLVKGVGTQFNTNVEANDLFQLYGENRYYEVLTITNATNLNLSATYSNELYSQTDTLTSRSYFTIVDKTTNYNFPELSPNEAKEFPSVFTKSMRMVDDVFYNASVHSMKVASDIKVKNKNCGIVLRSPDGTYWRIRIYNDGSVLTASSMVATTFSSFTDGSGTTWVDGEGTTWR